MRVRRYEAENMATALRNIREDLGPNAFVLSTRRIKKKDKFGQLRTLIEVSAASDVVEVKATKPNMEPAASDRKGDMIASLQSQVDQLKTELISFRTKQPNGSLESMREDLSEMRDLVELATDQWADETVKNYGPILSALFRRLTRSDIDRRLAAQVIAIASRELANCSAIGEKESLKVLFDVMKRQMLTSGPIELMESGPKTVLLVGPTGVGKTTTLAKIAARYSMFEKKKVGLLTIDTFRIGAVEQLRTYANILELPLKVANTPEQMQKFIGEYRDMDLVLVDTGGRSQKDRVKMAELVNFVGGRDDIYCELHLLLSCATKNRDLVEITREFGKLAIDYVLFTKLDECNTFGGIFNEVLWTHKPVSYLTTGQNVPDDIEVADAGRTVELVLMNSLTKRQTRSVRKGNG
ncbi:MAG TPA: flagellar biosynthesis protein FlhF [bacterium]|nr:flagellar biosynthesis protein FlhF [bacterium]